MSSQQQTQLKNLQLDDLLSAMLRAIPGTPPPTPGTKAFEKMKKELEAKLKAEIALTAKKNV